MNKNNNNDDCIWSPKILQDVVTTIENIRKQTEAQAKLTRMDMAVQKGIVYGIDIDMKVDMKSKINDLIGIKNPPKPRFYHASEMAFARSKLSNDAMDMINKHKEQSNRKVKACNATQRRTQKLYNEIRLATSEYYKKINAYQLDIAREDNYIETRIEKLFDDFIDEIRTKENHILLQDDVLEIQQRASFPQTESFSSPNTSMSNFHQNLQCPTGNQLQASKPEQRSPNGTGKTPRKQQKIEEKENKPLEDISVDKLKEMLKMVKNHGRMDGATN